MLWNGLCIHWGYLLTYFTVQQNIASLQDGFAQQFEALLNKVSSQNQMLKEMEDRVAKVRTGGIYNSVLSSLRPDVEFILNGVCGVRV